MYELFLKPFFYGTLLDEIDLFKASVVREHFLDNIVMPYVRKGMIDKLRARMKVEWAQDVSMKAHKTESSSLSMYLWTKLQLEVEDLHESVQAAKSKPPWFEKRPDLLQWQRVEREMIMALLYPRIDQAVFKDAGHPRKLPFSVHKKTGRIALPFDPQDNEFKPELCPTIGMAGMATTSPSKKRKTTTPERLHTRGKQLLNDAIAKLDGCSSAQLNDRRPLKR